MNNDTDVEKKGWFKKLKEGLKKTSSQLSSGIERIFMHRKLDEAAIEELEELLITSDIGPQTASLMLTNIRKKRFGQEVDEREIRQLLAEEALAILAPYESPLSTLALPGRPHVILMVGVNGGGKTTTISKLAQLFIQNGKSVRLVAADTFRAAAVEQLQVWGKRLGVPVETAAKGDAAGLVFDAYQKSLKEKDDVLLIDTAGRLHNRKDLMEELGKIERSLKKIDPTSPHQCLLVLDATTGQNLHMQVETFAQHVKISGLIMTKLDGTAKGGVLVSIADRFKLPIHAIGVGEQPENLKDFRADSFSKGILGLLDNDLG